MSYALEDLQKSKPLKSRIIAAGLEAAAGASDAAANENMLNTFSSLYSHLSNTALNLGRIKAIFSFSSSTGDKTGTLSSDQKDTIKRIEKKGYIASGSFLMHEIDGLEEKMLPFAQMLFEFSAMPDRVIETLEKIRTLTTDLNNDRELLTAISTANRINAIDCQLKLRAQLNAKIKQMIKEVKVNSKGRPIMDYFENGPQIEECMAIRNRVSHEIKPESTTRIVDLVKSLDERLGELADQVADQNRAIGPNAKTMAALSKLLYESAEMVQDLGIWYHYVNKFVVTMDALTNDRKMI